MAARHRSKLPPNRLRELREAKGLKPHELAVKLGVDPSTVYAWERRGGLDDETKLWLANFYGVTPAYLMGWPEQVAA